ncbi:MAG: protein kinase [Polyangiaceae bacterium]|nr:protein kinase [Polyangiaceae bacterium]
MNPEVERPAPAEAAAPKACPSCAKRYPADALFCSLDGAPLSTAPGAIAAAAANDPYVGHEIHGHIEIRQLVGIGAMGRVYRAFQRGIDRDVAVKILHRELSANAALVARFHREAKVASRLAHPHVVHVLLVGQLPDGAMHIVMEYLDGLSLQSALAAAGGAMALPRALRIALQLCDAAGEAHSLGIVHRDLKPENVMLVRRADDPDFVKILDFGIARLNWDEPSSATAAGLIFGTARYISPEGAQGERVGPQGDVYSIATIIYQMLSGRTPFDADQTVALLVQQIHDPPKPLRSVERSAYVPEAVADVIMRNLSKKPGDRAPDARALGRALLEAAVGSGLSAQDILARPALLGSARGEHPSAVQMPSMQRTRPLTLDPETAARLEAAPSVTPAAPAVPPEPSPRTVLKTAFEPPDGAQAGADGSGAGREGRGPTRTEISDPAALPPSSATVKWVPAPAFQARLAPGVVVAAPSTVGPDVTMDDQPQAALSARTVVLAPSSRGATFAPPALPAIAVPGAIASVPALAPPPSLSPASMPPLHHTPPPPSRPPSSVDSTLAGEHAPRALAQGPLVALVVGAFLIGVAGMSSLAWKAGLLGRTGTRSAAAAAAVDGSRPRAGSAHALPGEIDVAAQPPAEASRSTAVATGTNAGAGAAGETTAVPPLVAAAPGTAAPSSASSRATLEVSNGRPGPGQPVDFVARLPSPHGRLEDARFEFAGPGFAGSSEVPASDDGTGAFRTTFTFLQPGKFDVRFVARADGSKLAVGRTVLVGEASAPPRAPTEPTPAAGTPQAPGKWL